MYSEEIDMYLEELFIIIGFVVAIYLYRNYKGENVFSNCKKYEGFVNGLINHNLWRK